MTRSSAERPNVTALVANAAGAPASHNTAVPSSGPRKVEIWRTAPSSALAAVASRSPTIRGMPAVNAGR